MLPDCMQGPSEPCAGYTAQSARIDALEAALQAGRDVMAVIHGDGGHYREAHGDRKAADDAINIIYKLRADLDDARIELNRLRAGEMPGGWTAELESQIAARHAERERREAAEGLLDAAGLFLPDSKSQLARNVEANIKSHFARYKD